MLLFQGCGAIWLTAPQIGEEAFLEVKELVRQKINKCPKKDPSGEHWEMGSVLKGDKMSSWKKATDCETVQWVSNLFDFEFWVYIIVLLGYNNF